MYLNCHTYHSLRYGTLSPERLVMLARQHGIGRLALTDINNSTAMPEFVRLCRQYGIAPAGGMEFREKGSLRYIALARSNEGFREINAFRSLHNLSRTPLPERFPSSEQVFVIYPFADAPSVLAEHEYYGILPTQCTRFRMQKTQGRRHAGKLLALLPVSFGHAGEHTLHLHLRAIDNNILISQLRPTHTASPEHTFLPAQSIRQIYEPFILSNTEALLEQCQIDFAHGSPKNKKTFTGQASTDRELLHKLAMEGMICRYGKHNPEARRRIAHELSIIDQLGFSAYFLITWDIVRYSLSQGFHHVGRGSGANSIVAYCLRITDVDPIELDLYFERFINPKRSSPPDFDIDYSWKERDHVLSYIFEHYGQEHTALLGTSSTFQRRSLLRELGKVYGLPKAEIDALYTQSQSLRSPGKVLQQIRDVAERLHGFPNLRSIHAGGVLIPEQSICCYSALDLPPKGYPTVQWDMYTAEDLGFEKIDILSQRGIGHIHECAEWVQKNRGIQVDVHQVQLFKQDERTRALLRAGETTGCFYVESPAMRGLLKKLRCDNYLSLVAASSIIRPGVASSGMMNEYIRRFHQAEQVSYLHPVMEQQLKETYGVMVYQEDVIKVCHHFAGLDLADADVLRRAMSGKYRSDKEMQRISQRFFDNCRQKGYPESLTQEVWRQIASFAGYSFSKAHSASFAVESYQSMYLKAHFPLEFLTAVINNFGGFYNTAVYLNEARRYGARIEPPCVNHSSYHTSIEGKTIYIGLAHLQQMEAVTAHNICTEREKDGPYRSLQDLMGRTRLPMQQLIILIRINALRFTGLPKSQLLWQAYLLKGIEPQNDTLFPLPEQTFCLPEPDIDPDEQAWDEMELLGFTVSVSPFDLLQTSFRGDLYAEDMIREEGKKVRMTGWLVNTKAVRTVKKEIMYFGCFIDPRGAFFDTTHFPAAAKAFPFRGNGIYLLGGCIENSFGHPSLNVTQMKKLPLRPKTNN
jgi:error-prone DNA polymerase